MSNMHRETIARKKFPIVLMSFLLVVFSLFFVRILENISLGDFRLGQVLSVTLGVAVVLTLIYEFLKCKVKYKFFIIADQLIIHKISGATDKVVENIKIRNIEFIGKVKEGPKSINAKSTRRYTCSLFNTSPYCCVYKEGNVLRKFYFEASNNMVEKIKLLKEKRLAS